jgi:hypothetical protein
MQKQVNRAVKIVMILTCLSCWPGHVPTRGASAAGQDDLSTSAEAPPTTTRFLIVAKGKIADLPVRQPEHGGALLWDEYTDLLLSIPAKNVVVLTMSCFSGGFVEYLNSPPVRNRWKDRWQKEGRNLIVMTSQNGQLSSDPILKDKELVNPFTYAVAMALEGDADGFALDGGRPVPGQPKDGKISVGEMIDFILYTTENTVSETARRRNFAKPQLAGSFHRSDVLFERVRDSSSTTRNSSTAQHDAPADADKPRR